jgi:tetratricopeptide (TPR) repeat protein
MGRRIVATLLLAAGPAYADDPKQQAAQLFEQGRALDRDGHFVEACEKLTASYALDPAPGTELNLGDCHEHLGHLAEAWHRFDHASSQFDKTHDDRLKYALDRRNALEPKLGIIVVKHGVASEPVTIAGRREPDALEVRDRVDPGGIEVQVGAIVHHTAVAAGATAIVDTLPPPAVSPVLATPVLATPVLATPEPPEGARDHTRVWIAYGAWGIGGVSLGTAIGLGLAARSDYHAAVAVDGPCEHDSTGKLVCATTDGYSKVNHAITLANVATGFGVAGIALGAAGVFLYFTAPREHSLVVTPNASTSSAGLTLSGSF